LIQFVEPIQLLAFGQFLQPVHVSVQLVQSVPPVHWQLYSVQKHITITAITNQFFVKAHVLNAIVFWIIVTYRAVYFGRLLNSALLSTIYILFHYLVYTIMIQHVVELE
jgi:hypothetical protein